MKMLIYSDGAILTLYLSEYKMRILS